MIAGDASQGLAQHRLRHGRAVSGSHIKVVDAQIQCGMNGAYAFRCVHRTIHTPQRRRAAT